MSVPGGEPLDPEEPVARPAYFGRFAFGHGQLRSRAARGTIVNSLFMIGLAALGLVKGFIVAALIPVSDYGVWGVLVATLAAVALLKEVGVSDKYVQQEEPDQERAFQQAFTVESIMSAAALVLAAIAIPLASRVYDLPQLVAPGLVLALILPALALQSPTWIFYRRMEFMRQRSVQAVDPVVGFLVTVPLAVAGMGYWSLVIGAVAGSWAAALAALLASPYGLRFRLSRGTLRSYFSFSWPILFVGFGTLLLMQLSAFVGQAALGLAGTGAIVLASTVPAYAARVDDIVTQTIYPAVCAVKDRADLLLETFVKSNRLALMWGMPFGIGVTLFADDLVTYVIGEQWRSAVVLIAAFGAIAAVNHIGFNWTAFYRAQGNTKPLATTMGITLVPFCAIAIPLLATHGLNGFALGMAVTTAAALVARFVYLKRLFPDFRAWFHILRAIAPTVPAAALVLVMRWLEPGSRSPALAAAELVLYIVITIVATVALERRLLREMLGYLGRRQPVARPA
jgi:PST family polysaccharide transporter